MFHRFISVLLVNAVVCFAETPARIYVYVPRNAIVRSWVAVTCDGPLLARVRQGRFFAVDLPAGRHVLAIQDGVPLIVDLHSGEDAYFRLDAEVRVGEGRRPYYPRSRNRGRATRCDSCRTWMAITSPLRQS